MQLIASEFNIQALACLPRDSTKGTVPGGPSAVTLLSTPAGEQPTAPALIVPTTR